MPVRFRCTFCNTLLSIARRKSGMIIDCPKCKQKVTVPKPGDRPETATFEDDNFEEFLVGDGGPLSEQPGEEGPGAPAPKPPVGELVGTGRRTRSPRAKRLAKKASDRRKPDRGPMRESSRKAEIELDHPDKDLPDHEPSDEELAEQDLPEHPPDAALKPPGGPPRTSKGSAPTDGPPSVAADLDDDDVLDDVEIVDEPPQARPAERGPAPTPRAQPRPAPPPKRSDKPLAAALPVPPEPTPVDTPAIDALLTAHHRRTGVKVLKASLIVLLMVLMFGAGFATSHFDLLRIGGDGTPTSGEGEDVSGGVPRIRGQIAYTTLLGDRTRPDVGARLILLPRDRTPAKDGKVGWEGLATEPEDQREGPGPTGGATAIKALGGYVATADVEGTYELSRLKPGDYNLLVISALRKRPPDQPMDDSDFDLLARYFQGVKLILGTRQYELRPVRVKEKEDITFNHRFGRTAPAEAPPAKAPPAPAPGASTD